MTKKLTLGFSPCPNDTYIFNALVHNLIPSQLVSFAPPLLEDVETLNHLALAAKLDVTKLSFHAMGHVLDDYVMLSSGAALGRGCGPLLVTRPGFSQDLEHITIGIPGAYTTAAMLLRLYAPKALNLKIMRFEEIMPAVIKGKVDAGVIIHESRFTYQDLGLILVRFGSVVGRVDRVAHSSRLYRRKEKFIGGNNQGDRSGYPCKYSVGQE